MSFAGVGAGGSGMSARQHIRGRWVFAGRTILPALPACQARRGDGESASQRRQPILVWGSLTADGRLTLGHFREALGSRLYAQALRNSLVLGLWTAALSVAIGLPLAWASSHT